MPNLNYSIFLQEFRYFFFNKLKIVLLHETIKGFGSVKLKNKVSLFYKYSFVIFLNPFIRSIAEAYPALKFISIAFSGGSVSESSRSTRRNVTYPNLCIKA